MPGQQPAIAPQVRPARRLPVIAAAAVVVLLLTVVTAGCTPPQTPPGEQMDPRAQLMARPSFEQAEQQYLDLLGRLRALIDTRAPHLQWLEPQPSRSDVGGGCRKPFNMDGVAYGIYDAGGTGATGGIDDATWTPLLAEITTTLRQEGFTLVNVLQDKPGEHRVDFINPDTEASVRLGTEVNTTLSLSGGCFLHESARQSPTPT
ncbi:MAG: LppA family lipoprotein [Dermatophilaceae bacterium]